MVFDHRALFALDGREFILNCYNVILGRSANNEEIDGYFVSLQKRNKIHIIIDMLASEECKRNFPDRNFSLAFSILLYGYRNNKIRNSKLFNILLEKYDHHIDEQFYFYRILSKKIYNDFFSLSKKLDDDQSMIKILNDKCLSIFDLQKQIVKINSAISLEGLTLSTGKKQLSVDEKTDDELAAYYKAFEDAHRGSLDDILSKQSQYLPLIKGFEINNKNAIDIGCGRGEWLSLLKSNGFKPVGVDMNPVMVRMCQEKGLEAVVSDASDYLQNQFESSIGLITGFHIIEHIGFEVLFNIAKESKRVLQPGGIVIFETPNPENIMVGSNTFYDDFSHKNPLTPNSVKFLFEYLGFSEVRIERLNPNLDIKPMEGSGEPVERLNKLLYGPRDFAVIARK